MKGAHLLSYCLFHECMGVFIRKEVFIRRYTVGTAVNFLSEQYNINFNTFLCAKKY